MDCKCKDEQVCLPHYVAGQGIEALISLAIRLEHDLEAKSPEAGDLFDLPYGGLRDPAYNNVPSLVPSILDRGWVQTMAISIIDGKICDGWRRIQALKILGWAHIRVEVQEVTLKEMSELNITRIRG